MTRRIVRSFTQIAILLTGIFVLIYLLESRYSVLPQAIHSALPLHHEVLVITDITVKTCSSTNPFKSCRLDPDTWHRVEKDLYLNSGWSGSAWLHVQRKKEEELIPGQKIVVDVRVSRLDPGMSEHGQVNEKWESRPGGIWLLRSSKKHESDGTKAVTGVDILFGPDAVDPRPGWTLTQTPLLLNAKDGSEPRLTIRHGTPKESHKEPPVLRIRKDGKFKILQVSDLHLSTGVGACRDTLDEKGVVKGKCEADPRTLAFVEKIRDEEKPDMVVLSGDQVNGETAPDVQTAMFKFAELFIAEHIPYAAIFGNHDDEGKSVTKLTRESQMSLLNTLPYSLSRFGPDDVDGVGNYYVEVLAQSSSHPALTLYFMDTHSYSPNEAKYKGYDWIKPNQIAWFKDTARTLKKSNNLYTRIHMNMAFIHIPLPEFAMPGNLFAGGEHREPSTAPRFNSGFYAALKEQGILAVGCGHDHVNDMCGLRPLEEKKALKERDATAKKSHGAAATDEAEEKEEVEESSRTPTNDLGPWMCHAGASGFGGYAGYGGYHRRVRVWEVDTNAGRITTWTRIECCGADTKLKHNEMIIVEGGKIIPPSTEN